MSRYSKVIAQTHRQYGNITFPHTWAVINQIAYHKYWAILEAPTGKISGS